ncbi:MAG: hypothetical protein J5779_01000 [Clostridia bacterium]|nr:hypothetical protein [Clostridia bacterium]
MSCCNNCGGYYNLNSINNGIGVSGPQGPQGPAGAPAISVAAEFIAPAATNEDLVLTAFTSYPGTQTSIVLNSTNNNVELTGGTYLIRYGTVATNTGATLPTISLTFNGVVYPITTRTGAANATNTLSGDLLITVLPGTTVGLETTNSAEITYTNSYLIIEKLS